MDSRGYLSCDPRPGEMLLNNEDCQQQGVPKKFLKQIIQDLLRCGLIKSKRGACGGYTLARSPGEISFYDVIEAIEDRRPGHRGRALPIESAALTNSVGKEKR